MQRGNKTESRGARRQRAPQGSCMAFPGTPGSPRELCRTCLFFCFSEVHKSLHHIYEQKKKKKKTFLTSKWLPALRVRPDSKSGSQSTVSAAHQASSQSSLGLTPPPQGLPTLAFRQCPLPRFTGREKDGLGPLSGLGREESYHRRGEVQTSGTQPASWCKAETDKPVKVTSQSPRASLWSQDPQPGPRMLSMSSSTGYTTALESAVGPRAIRSLRAMSH